MGLGAFPCVNADGMPHFYTVIDSGFESEEQRQLAMQPNFTRDGVAVLRMVVGDPPKAATRRRRDLLPDSAWYGSSTYKLHREPAGLDDAMFSFHPVSDGSFSGLGLHRRLGRTRFSQRDREVADLIVSQLDWLHQTSTGLETADRATRLGPQLRRVLIRLLAGDSVKQIASKLRLSQHTVKDYTKAIHRHFNVSTRSELSAKFIFGDATAG